MASCGADRRRRAAAGEHVVHIGAGVGYYTAILAKLVGAEGRVTAIEFDAELAARAKCLNLNRNGCIIP